MTEIEKLLYELLKKYNVNTDTDKIWEDSQDFLSKVQEEHKKRFLDQMDNSWIRIHGNLNLFAKYSRRNCLVKYPDGKERRFDEAKKNWIEQEPLFFKIELT